MSAVSTPQQDDSRFKRRPHNFLRPSEKGGDSKFLHIRLHHEANSENNRVAGESRVQKASLLYFDARESLRFDEVRPLNSAVVLQIQAEGVQAPIADLQRAADPESLQFVHDGGGWILAAARCIHIANIFTNTDSAELHLPEFGQQLHRLLK